MTDAELVAAEQLARRAGSSNCWTGTAGSVASALLCVLRHYRGAIMNHDETPAEALLGQAQAVVRQRRATYGPPREHFARTVAAVNAIFSGKLREPFTEADWAMVMILDKCARHQGTCRSADTPIDLAGYAACLAECEATAQHG